MSYQTDCDLGWKLSWKLSRFVEFCHVLSPAWVLTSHPTYHLCCAGEELDEAVDDELWPWRLDHEIPSRTLGQQVNYSVEHQFLHEYLNLVQFTLFLESTTSWNMSFFFAEAHPSISMKTLILKKWNRDCEVHFFHHVSGYWSSKSTSF